MIIVLIGGLLLGWALYESTLGRTYTKYGLKMIWVYRAKNPWWYWSALISKGIAGLLIAAAGVHNFL